MKKKILILKPDDIGDVILLIPFLKELRKQRPEHRITLASHPKMVPLMETLPYIDEVIAYSRSESELSFTDKINVLISSWHWLRRNHGFLCNEVYLMRPPASFSEKMLVQLSFGRIRTGWKNGGWPGLYTRTLNFQKGLHEAEQLLRALPVSASEVSDCHFPCSKSALSVVDKMLPEGGRFLAIGANQTKDVCRNWPVEFYAEFIQRVHEQDAEIQFILLGGQEDISSNKEIICLTGDYVKSVAGKCTLMETYAILHRCFLFVGNDSGPMHLAAAARVPVLEISYYPTGGDVSHWNAPERFGPFGVPFRVCRPVSAPLPQKEKDDARNVNGIRAVRVSDVFETYISLCKETGNIYV